MNPSFQPSVIAIQDIRQIPNSPWSVLRHRPNLFFFYHEDFANLNTRPYTISEELHVSVFVQHNRFDFHATWVYADNKGRFYKRHHGYRRCRNGKRQFKSANRPVQLRSLFEEFERSLPELERHIERILVSINRSNNKLKYFITIKFQRF